MKLCQLVVQKSAISNYRRTGLKFVNSDKCNAFCMSKNIQFDHLITSVPAFITKL